MQQLGIFHKNLKNCLCSEQHNIVFSYRRILHLLAAKPNSPAHFFRLSLHFMKLLLRRFITPPEK
jgi:hypothetical protein